MNGQGMRINFVTDLSEAELEQYRRMGDVDKTARADRSFRHAIADGVMCWCALTYLHLRHDSRVRAAISNRIDPDAVNVVHSKQLLLLGNPEGAFVVCVRADYRRRPWAQHEIVQNDEQAGPESTRIYLWPQPGLIGRDPSRSGVRTVAYVGYTVNGNLAWTPEDWNRLFHGEGLEFVVQGPDDWHDLSGVDVLVGVRSFDRRSYPGKPPSKLINAWMAHIPFVGGSDSAFRQIGRDGENYMLAHTPEMVLNAVRRLRDDPALYAAMVADGAASLGPYTVDSLRDQWIAAFNGPIRRRYESWLGRPRYEQIRSAGMATVSLAGVHARALARRMLR